MFDSYKVCSPLAYLHWLCELEVFSSLFAWFSLTSLAKENNPCFFVALLQFQMKISPRLCVTRNRYIRNFHRKCLECVLAHPYKQKMKMPFCNKTSLPSWRDSWAGERRRSRQLPRRRICERRRLFTNPLTGSPLAFTASLPKQKHSRAKSRQLRRLQQNWKLISVEEKCLKHITSFTLVKCKSMTVSIVMPSYPNVTLFLWYVVHWTTARILNMKIDHNIP